MAAKKNLSGLILVFIALLIELFATFASSFAASNAVFASVGSWISIGGIVLAIIGLTMLSHVNKNFAKSRIYYIISICISIVYAILAVVAIKVPVLVGIIGIIFVIALFIFSLLRVKTLMYGCADIANENGDRAYAQKCENAWRNYLVSQIIYTAASIIMFIVFMASIGTAMVSEQNNEALAAAGVALGVGIVVMTIIVLAACVYRIVATIMVLTKTIGTYSRYKGGTIGSYNASRGELKNEMKNDRKNLFSDAQEDFDKGVSEATEDVKDAADAVGDNMKKGFAKVGSGITGAATKVGDATKKGLDNAKEGVSKAGESIKDGAVKAGEGIKNGASKIGEAAAKAGDDVADKAERFGDAAKDGFETFKEELKDTDKNE